MNIIRLSFYWGQVIAALLITLFLGIVPLVRCFLNHSDNFYKICFSILIYVGISLLLRPGIKELREALKTPKV